MSAIAPHFRIVYPKEFIGKRFAAIQGRVYVTWPGKPEELLPNVVSITPTWEADGVFSIDVRFVGSCTIEYQSEESA